jgi:hypothetical protein
VLTATYLMLRLALRDSCSCSLEDILGICSTVRETKHFVTNFEAPLGAGGNGLDGARELDSHGRAGLWGKWVIALALDEVHAVDTEAFYLDDGLRVFGCRFGGLGVNVESGGGAFASFDSWT